MPKTEKVWRVLPKYEGRVTVETECKHVVLSNKLSQEQLSAFAENPSVAVFLELTAQPAQTDGK